jgi:hypothetical protein
MKKRGTESLSWVSVASNYEAGNLDQHGNLDPRGLHWKIQCETAALLWFIEVELNHGKYKNMECPRYERPKTVHRGIE